MKYLIILLFCLPVMAKESSLVELEKTNKKAYQQVLDYKKKAKELFDKYLGNCYDVTPHLRDNDKLYFLSSNWTDTHISDVSNKRLYSDQDVFICETKKNICFHIVPHSTTRAGGGVSCFSKKSLK